MKKIFLFLSIGFSLLSPAFASSLITLGDIPIKYFTEEDAQMLKTAQMTALNKYPDGKKLSWKNDATGAGGWVMPSKTFRKNGLTCRTLTTYNSARGRVGQSSFKLCKINDSWKIAKLKQINALFPRLLN